MYWVLDMGLRMELLDWGKAPVAFGFCFFFCFACYHDTLLTHILSIQSSIKIRQFLQLTGRCYPAQATCFSPD